MISGKSVALLWVTLATVSCGESRVDSDDPRGDSAEAFVERLESLTPELLEEFRVPGAAVGFLQDGEPFWIGGFGFADAGAGKPVTSQTGFNIGSISKTVASWGLLRLVEAGKLDLDTPVETYLTRWHLSPTEFDANGVTLRRLLSHTAGLSLHGYPGWNPDEPLPSIEESLSGSTNGSGDVRLIMAPGTEWKYSGGGYTLAQLLVEEVTDTGFAEFMELEVVRPLGMVRSSYDLTPEVLSGSSLAHDTWGEPTPGPRFTAQAAAGFHTTIEDLALFAAAVMEGADGRPVGRGLLRPETVAMMLEPAPASEGTYGLGYSVQQLSNGQTVNGHGGANTGWHALLNVVPETGNGIIILTNGSNGWAVHQQIRCAWGEWTTGERPVDGCKKPIGLVLLQTIIEDGVQTAIRQYRDLKQSAGEDYNFSEEQLNSLGYGLIEVGRIPDAIEVFELNVEEYPDGFNTYDSLGEGYMLAGRNDLARRNYEKSLELNPENSNAADMLEKLAAE